MFLLTHRVWGSTSAALELTYALAQAAVAQLLATSHGDKFASYKRVSG